MKIGERQGNGRGETLRRKRLDHNKWSLSTYQAILKDVRENRMKGGS
jgi:hypothetical protein